MELSQSRIASQKILPFAALGNPDSARPETALSHRAIIKMRREVAMTETDINRVLLPQRVSLMLAVALIAGMAGFVAGLYCSADMEASVVRFSWTAAPSHEDRIAISPVPDLVKVAARDCRVGKTMILVVILMVLVVAIALVIFWLFKWEGESDPSW